MALACAHAKLVPVPAPPVETATPLPEPPPVPASAMADDPYAAAADAGPEAAPMPRGAIPSPAPPPPVAGPSPSTSRGVLASAIQREVDANDLRRARRDALRWLLSCGPDDIEGCRERGLERLRQLAAKPPVDRSLEKRLAWQVEADVCVVRVERLAVADPCLAKAEVAYRTVGDRLMVQRALLAMALSVPRAKAARRQSGLKRAIAACRELRCSPIRAAALRAYAAWLGDKGRLEQELTFRFKGDRAAAAAEPAEIRPYVRSRETDDACERYDGTAGDGRCRALERRVTGGWSFHDWSIEKVEGDLPREKILAVNRHYVVTLEACLKSEGKRLEGSAVETVGLRWMIGTDGKVARFEVDPALDPANPLQACFSEALALWRYPASTGENQHVEQSFTVTATER